MSANLGTNTVENKQLDGNQTEQNDYPLTADPVEKALYTDSARLHYKPDFAPQKSKLDVPNENNTDQDDVIEAMELSPINNTNRSDVKRPFWFLAAQALGTLGSVGWVFLCGAYYILEGGFAAQTPYEFGVFMAGILAPIAFYWMLLSYLQRKSDVQFYAETLRSEMHSLFFPSEEDSRRVNKDIETMMHQASELATMSKTVMGSIQKTRQGLREEIKQFATFASKTEGHMTSLADSLGDRVGGLSEMVDVIKQRIEIIETHSQGSITSWDSASAKMVERANDIAATMERGSGALMSSIKVAEDQSKAASDMFDGTITSLGLTVDAVVTRLGGINEEFGAHTRSLSISTQELSKESDRIRVMIDDQVEGLKDATGQAVESITQSLLDVSDRREEFEKTSDGLMDKTNHLATVVNESLSQLNETTEGVVSRADVIGEKIVNRSNMITDVMSGFDDQIDRMDSTSKTVSHRLTESIETAYSSANEISDATRKASEMLLQTMTSVRGDADAMIDVIGDNVDKLEEGRDQAKSLIDVTEAAFDKIHTSIDQSTTISQNHMKISQDTFEKQTVDMHKLSTQLCNQIRNVSTSIEEPMRQMSMIVSEADSRHAQIETTLSSRIDALKDASQKASDNVENIRMGLREQTQEISMLSGQLMQQSKVIHEEMSGQKQELAEVLDMSGLAITDYIVNLGETQEKITSVSDGVASVVNDMDESLSMSLKQMKDTSHEVTSVLRETSVFFEKKSSDYAKGLQSSQLALVDANDQLHKHCNAIEPLYLNMQEQAEKTTSIIAQYQSSFVDVSDIAQEKIATTVTKLDDHLVSLRQGTSETLSSINASSDILQSRVVDITSSLEGIQGRMDSVNASMEAKGEAIHIMTDKAILKIDAVQNTLQNQFQELSENVGLSVSQIEDAGNRFTARASVIAQEADNVVARIVTIGDEAHNKAYELKQASQNISDVTTQSVQHMVNEINAVTMRSDKALINLEKTADTLSIKSKEIDASAEAVLNQAKSYVIDVRDHIGKIAVQSEDTAVQIGHSVSSLVQTMDKVTDKTKLAVDYIKDTNQSLFVQSGQFIAAVTKSTDVVDGSTQSFIQQTENLLKASNLAGQRIEDIRKNELQAGQKAFLSSARFVLESLHSLSIDFVRMMDGQISDKDWKAYQDGDVTLFSMRLAQRLDALPSQKVSDKFAEDHEFRTYVQKFIHQFEDILNQTDDVDKGAILNATFGSSDIGKIYRYLCKVAGRDFH